MKPILFNTAMVRAILDGRKTVTRRVIKFPEDMTGRLPESGATDYLYYPCGIKYPPYKKGDILYVRETWAIPYGKGYYYAADYHSEFDVLPADNGDVSVSKNCIRWHPSIHMPKEAARLFLHVTDVRVERLREMTVSDLQNEGELPGGYISQYATMTFECFDQFKALWDSTIKPADIPRYGWDANPWVWVIEFERCEKPEEDVKCEA